MFLKHKSIDGLKVHLALPGQFLIPLVAAMTFLAALMIAGSYASQSLAQRWNMGAASTVILQIPSSTSTSPQNNVDISSEKTNQINTLIAFLSTSKELDSFHKLSDKEINTLLSPWLHEDISSFALPIPAVIELHLKPNTPLSENFKNNLKNIVPDIVIEQSNYWTERLSILANSLQTSAFIALFIVIGVAMAVIALSTRTGLVHCRQTLDILHNLGASDSYICFRFAKRSALLSLIGGIIGSFLSIPLLLFLTYLSLPFSNNPNWQLLAQQNWFSSFSIFPFELLIISIMLPLCDSLIGWLATTFIVYFWLKRLT